MGIDTVIGMQEQSPRGLPVRAWALRERLGRLGLACDSVCYCDASSARPSSLWFQEQRLREREQLQWLQQSSLAFSVSQASRRLQFF